MKTTKLVAVLGVATFATAILGTTVVQADDSTTTKGRVEFVESDNQGIVDPTKPGPNPEVVVPPGTGLPEIEGEDGNSSLILFADLDFGTHKVTKVATKYSAQQSKTNVWKDTEGKTLTGTDFENYGKDGVLPQFLQLRTTKDATVTTVKAQLGDFKLLDDDEEVITGSGAKTLDITNISFSNVKIQDNTIAGAPTSIDDFALIPEEAAIDVYTFGATTNGSIRSLIFGKMEGAPYAGLEEDQGDKAADQYYNNGIQLNLPNSSNMKAGEKYKAVLTWTLASTPAPQP